MSERAGRRLSRYGLCYGLLLALCVTASGCASTGSATRTEPHEETATHAADTDMSQAPEAETSAAEERSDDTDEWRELEPDKDDEVVVMTAWLVTTLAALAAAIAGVIALF